jgi:hypothetical protein
VRYVLRAHAQLKSSDRMLSSFNVVYVVYKTFSYNFFTVLNVRLIISIKLFVVQQVLSVASDLMCSPGHVYIVLTIFAFNT